MMKHRLPLRRLLVIGSLAIGATFHAAAQVPTAERFSAENAWVPWAPSTVSVHAAYMTIVNRSDEDRFVVSAEADRSGHPPSPGHLRQHMTYGDRVTVRYRDGKDGPLALEVIDAS